MIGTADNEFFGKFSIAPAAATILVPASLSLTQAELEALGLADRRSDFD